jgi:hypothetical protein
MSPLNQLVYFGRKMVYYCRNLVGYLGCHSLVYFNPLTDTQWREQRRQGQLTGLQGQKRGRKAEPQAAELGQLRQENERLKAQLERAELIIEAQKKLCQLFNLPLSDREGLK